MVVTIAIDRHAVDKLHHQKRCAVLGLAAIDQMRDVRVFETRKNLPLGAKALNHIIVRRAITDELDRDSFLVRIVRANSLKDRPHAAACDLSHDLVSAQATPNPRLREAITFRFKRRVQGVTNPRST